MDKATKAYFKLTNRAAKLQLDAYRQAYKEIEAEMARMWAKLDEVTLENSFKYKRLQNLLDSVNKRITQLYGTNKTVTRRGMKETAKLGYYSTAAQIETKLGDLKMLTLNTKAIDSLSLNPMTGLTVAETFGKNLEAFKVALKQNLSVSLIQGKSYTQAAKDLKTAMNIDYAKARTIATTEMHRAQLESSIAAYEEAEEKGAILKKVWQHNPQASMKPREDHAAMDGKEADEDGYFTLPSGARGKAPGLFSEASETVNCHCSLLTLPVAYEPKYRRVRGEDGKNMVIKYSDYADFAAGKKVEKVNFEF